MEEHPADPNELATLARLVEIMHEHDLDALKVTVGGQLYELVRREGSTAAAPPPAPVTAKHPAVAPGAPANVKRVTAPLVGVFYSAPAPGAQPFVNVGDRVEAGQVVCILEAMKLMNEITTEYSGNVVRVIPENGELVSLGEDLMWIEA